MNIFSNMKLFTKFIIHSLLFLIFLSIFIFSKLDLNIHTKLPFILIIAWICHIYLNKQFFISFIGGKLKSKEAFYKIAINIVLFFAIACTLITGNTLLAGEFFPFITIDFAYTYHSVLAFSCIIFLCIHLFQNRRAVQFIWKKLFK